MKNYVLSDILMNRVIITSGFQKSTQLHEWVQGFHESK